MPTYARGHVRLPNKDQVIALRHAKHRGVMAALQQIEAADEPHWDSRDKNWVPPVKNQASCGSCWCFSGTGVVEVAFIVAAVFPADGSKSLSEQYTLDCGRNGGCNGDDNVTVLDWAKKTGLPFTSDYGSYQAREGRCKSSASAMNQIKDWGFADANGGNGVTPTDMIKKAIKTFGCVGCAVAAGSSWDGWSSDPNYVHKGNSRQIDHDVILIGWDDPKGAWLMRNSWGTGWAWNGCGWIAYGADEIGTEAVWAVTENPNPVPPPRPPDAPINLFI